jgi:hypothetical protein
VWGSMRLGGPEEKALRPPADGGVKEEEVSAWLGEEASPEPKLLRGLIEGEAVVTDVETDRGVDGGGSGGGQVQAEEASKDPTEESAAAATMAIVGVMPSWLCSGEDSWSDRDLDFLCPTHEVIHLYTYTYTLKPIHTPIHPNTYTYTLTPIHLYIHPNTYTPIHL